MKTACEITFWRNWRACFALGMLIAFVNAAAAQAHYSVKDLGTLGGTFGFAQGINNKGWVDGFANLPGDKKQHAFLWLDGLKIDLGTLGGPNSQAYLGPSERGQVAGLAETSTRDPNKRDFCFFGTGLICRAFLWETGVMTDLGTLGGNNSSAFAINNRSQVVGAAENKMPDPTCTTSQFQFKPFIWQKGKMEELPTFADDPDGVAEAINNNGHAAGSSGTCTMGLHALLWQNGTATDLGNLGGTLNNVALNINNRNQVVGESDLPGDTTNHAFLWQDGVMTDLGTLDFASGAFGINQEGLVVGVSCDMTFSTCSAFLWQDGVMRDLNTLIPPGSPLHLFWAISINSRGEIVGLAIEKSTRQPHAFVAIPCNEDGSEPEGCEDDGETPTASSQANLNVVMPENLRKLIQQRIRVGRLEGGLIMQH